MITLYLILSICTGTGCELDRPMVDMDMIFPKLEDCEARAAALEKQMQDPPDAVPGWHSKCIIGWKRPQK